VRGGRFIMPAESNGLALDTRIFRHYGDQVELEHRHTWMGQAGTVRLLAFHDRVRMGGFRDALAAAAPGTAPSVADVRRERGKTGFGASLDQALGENAAVFARASRNDGQSETYAFAEIERSLSAGVTLQGAPWGRAGDTVGVAVVRNGLTQAHRDYLAAGGVGAFIGDGGLDYHPERIAEAYYKVGLGEHAALSLDWQHVANPAYNGARGPVNVFGLRLHGQY
jgi:carbohydrate-selective porin OprB